MTANLRTLTKEKRESPMKRSLMPAAALPTMKKIAFTLLCCSLLVLFAAPAWASCGEEEDCESHTMHYAPGINSQTFTSDNGDNSITLTVTSVINEFDVTVDFHYVDTEFTPFSSPGPGTVDGICEGGTPPLSDNDIDCRLAAGGFVYKTFFNGDKLVSHCPPSHGPDNKCTWYRATTSAVAPTDYVGPVSDIILWNQNLSLASPPANGEYTPGWNNNNARLYDRPGTAPNPFQSDITDFFDPSLSLPSSDPGGGGHQPTLNDWVFGHVPNPQPGTADEVETLVPVPGISPFPYIAGLPMLVTFELETAGTEHHDPTALTKPHAVNVATLDSTGASIPVQFPKGFPKTFTYSPFLKVYYIFLSPAPYSLGTVYTLQIGSDLFPQPVTRDFKVCTAAQIKNHTCP